MSFRKDQIAGLYQAKAMLAYNKGKIDSAIYYFHKQIESDSTYNTLTMGYAGLMNCYSKKFNADSLRLYTELYCHYNDSTINNLNGLTLERIQLLYNYRNHELQALKKTQKAHRNMAKVWILLIALFSVITSAFYIIYKHKQIKKREILELQRQHEAVQLQLQNEKSQYIKLQEKKYDLLQEEKTITINKLQSKLHSIRRTLYSENVGLQQCLLQSEIRNKFSLSIIKPGIELNNEDWKELAKLVEGQIPSFYSHFYNEKYMASSLEYKIILLIRTYFTPKEMSILLNMSQQSISIIRHRLFEKFFDKKGSAKEFDKMVKSISL